MKKTIVYLLLLLLALSACRKKYNFPDPALKKIVGKWNWIRTEGGITGLTFFPKADGSDALSYEFTERSLCFIRTVDNITKFIYEIYQDTSMITKQPAWFLSYHRTGIRKYNKIAVVENRIEFFGNDTLALSMDAADGQTIFLVREE